MYTVLPFSQLFQTMKKTIYQLLYTLAYCFWYGMSLLPLRVLYLLSDALYLPVAKLIRYRHRVIWNNLKSSFPEKTDQELRTIERRFYHQFCDYIVETIKLMTMSREQLMHHIKFEGMDEMNADIRQGLSCGIFLGHVFNWEWITSLPNWVPEGVICAQLYHPLENNYFDKLFKFVRERQHALSIPMQESLRKIVEFRHKSKAIVVGYIADQVPMWNNIHLWLPFLNHPETPVLTGAERIIKHMRQVAFYADVYRVRRGYYVCEMKPMAKDTHGIPDFQLTEQYFTLLEETIRRQPENYLWSHNRWKRTKEAFDREFEVVDGKVRHRRS